MRLDPPGTGDVEAIREHLPGEATPLGTRVSLDAIVGDEREGRDTIANIGV